MSDHLGSEDLAVLARTGAAIPEHVASCDRCAAELESFRVLAGTLRGLTEPPEQLRARALAYFERRCALDGLIASMAEDPALRARVAKDPGRVLRDAGLDADPDLIAALRDVERGSSEAGLRLAARLWI